MDVTALVEGAEAESMFAYEMQAPPALGAAAARIGGGVALSVRNDPTGYWSKALGFGFTEPVTHRLVGRIVDFYRSAGTPGATIQIAPSVLPPDWEEICSAYGLRSGSPWVKLAAPIEQVRPSASTRLRVAPVEPGDAAAWADVLLRGFGMPTVGLGEMLGAAVANPAFRPYGVWDGADLVGGGNLFVHGSVAALNGAAILPDHRNLGAQSALIAARVEAARAAGCRWVVAETGKPAEGSTNPSLTNLERAGLRVRYARQNWRWHNDSMGEQHV
jgi:GNAT superfamily N-acetyltransferase